MRAFLDEALALVPDHLKPARLAAGADRRRRPSSHSQAGTLAAIREALAWIPNADLDYDSWVRIGLALKGALGDAGGDLFAAWSAQSGKDDAAFTAKTWAGLKAERIGAGTIYHLAMERGWRPDPALVLDGAAPADAVHPAAGLLARVQVAEPTPAALAPQPSFDLRVPEGILAEMVDYMVSTARRPQPLLSLGASLCALGALMGRKYRTETNLRSQPLRRRHRRQRLGQEPRPRDRQRALLRGRARRASRRQQDRLRRRAADRAAPPAGAAPADRRVRHVPLGRGRPEAQPAAHHRDPRQHDRALHRRRQRVPRRRIRQPRRARTSGATSSSPASASTAPRRRCTSGTRCSRPTWSTARSPASSSCRPRTTIPRRRSAAASAPRRSDSSSSSGSSPRAAGTCPSGNLAGLGAGASTAVEPMTVPMTPEASAQFRRARRGRSRASCAKRGAPATPRCWRASARTRRSSRSSRR